MLHPDPQQRPTFEQLQEFILDGYLKDQECFKNYEAYEIKKKEEAGKKGDKDRVVDEDFMNKMNEKIRKALKTNEKQPVKIYPNRNKKGKSQNDFDFIGRYQGFLNEEGYPQGAGKFYFLNGEKYEGMWSNGKFHGIGRYYWVNGMKYYGEFKNDEMEGYGICYY